MYDLRIEVYLCMYVLIIVYHRWGMVIYARLPCQQYRVLLSISEVLMISFALFYDTDVGVVEMSTVL